MHSDEAGGAVCRCGHPRDAHEHYRRGTECALCVECPRFRPSAPAALVPRQRDAPRSLPVLSGAPGQLGLARDARLTGGLPADLAAADRVAGACASAQVVQQAE